MADYDPYGGNGDPNIDPNTGLPYGQQPAAAPSAPAQASGAPNTPAPGNDANQIQGWASQYLGRNFTDADIAALNGQPLSAVQHGIANSAEADAYNRSNQLGNYKPQAPAAPGAPAPSPVFGGGGSSTGFTWQPLQRDPRFDTLVNTLMSRANASLNIDPSTDPIIRPQVDNYAAQQERQRRTYLDQQAESSSPYATGSMDNARTQTSEQAGLNTSNMQASLMSNELTARRSEIQNAMSQAGQMLTADQQMQLQNELGQIDAQLKQQGLSSQNDQFLAQLGLNAQNQSNYWDAIRSGLIKG